MKDHVLNILGSRQHVVIVREPLPLRPELPHCVDGASQARHDVRALPTHSQPQRRSRGTSQSHCGNNDNNLCHQTSLLAAAITTSSIYRRRSSRAFRSSSSSRNIASHATLIDWCACWSTSMVCCSGGTDGTSPKVLESTRSPADAQLTTLASSGMCVMTGAAL